MRALSVLDWSIVGGYLLLALLVGVVVSRRAGGSTESYYAAGRNLPWWWLGTSMVATTFAADTPLVVAGMVARNGIAGNWFWWSWAISHVSMAVIFAGLWRRARVLTDAELVELRYTGRSASLLRAFKAVFFAGIVNGIVLGWVIRAMAKIARPFTRWPDWLGEAQYASLASEWPTWMLLGDLSDTLTIFVLFGVIAVYSSLGGIRGVILTDLVQFGLAIVGSIAFAVLAVREVGGIGAIHEGLAAHYPDPGEILAFFPGFDAAWLPVQVFLVYLAVQWWAQYFSDGSGYLAQRLFTARSDAHAEAGSLWFVVANYGLRTWPWVLIGVVALVVYPLGAEGDAAGAAMVAADREMAYPVLMARVLPAGLLGLLFASLLAAFMSTVDTHLNWASSYLVNDLYGRFLRPAAKQRELVLVGRTAVFLLAAVALFVAGRIQSIEQAWKFFVELGAGLGLPAMLRWIWWRVNAWTEIVGMTVAAASAVVVYTLFPEAREEYLLLAIVGAAMPAALVATFLTRPVPRDHLQNFVTRVRPPGWWSGVGGEGARRARRAVPWSGGAWVLGNISVFSLTFGVGHLVLGGPLRGVLLATAGAAGCIATLSMTRRAREILG